MSNAGLPRERGNSLASTLSKTNQHTHAMTAEQREAYKDSENAKLEKLFGPDWHDTKLKPVAVMIHELDQQRPGLKELSALTAIMRCSSRSCPGRHQLSRTTEGAGTVTCLCLRRDSECGRCVSEDVTQLDYDGSGTMRRSQANRPGSLAECEVSCAYTIAE